ncbi:cytochrome C [Catalinimonas niigatensis]|uniref:cytochrome C n=1 Tax=Catalinimonas niigatensis TaxID=1397264 RepID=UPI002AA2A882|nr:cytochrome C [Catalinimonas niigatensis]WPP51957.1 cytochrome C [Catalinimonas niigatensis]
MKDIETLEDKRVIKIFLDDEDVPFAEFKPPVKFMLDTTKIPDGKHRLKIVAKSSNNVEGIKVIPFEVRNGPEIAVVGLRANEVVDEKVSITVNAYGSERRDQFVVTGSETPKGIPAWVWAIVIGFIGFAIFYFIMYWTPDFYKSFF